MSDAAGARAQHIKPTQYSTKLFQDIVQANLANETARLKAKSSGTLYDKTTGLGKDNLVLPGHSQAINVLSTGLTNYANYNVENIKANTQSQNDFESAKNASLQFSGALLKTGEEFDSHYDNIGTYGDDAQSSFENINSFKPVLLGANNTWYEVGYGGADNTGNIIGGVSIVDGQHLPGEIGNIPANQLLAPDYASFENGQYGAFVGKRGPNDDIGYWYRHFVYENGNVVMDENGRPVHKTTNLLNDATPLYYQKGYKMNLSEVMTPEAFNKLRTDKDIPLAYGANSFSIVQASYDLDGNINYDNHLVGDNKFTVSTDEGDIKKPLTGDMQTALSSYFDPSTDVSSMKFDGTSLGLSADFFINRVIDDNNQVMSVSLKDDKNNYSLIVQNLDLPSAIRNVHDDLFLYGGEETLTEYGRYVLNDVLNRSQVEVMDDVLGSKYKNLKSGVWKRDFEYSEDAKQKYINNINNNKFSENEAEDREIKDGMIDEFKNSLEENYYTKYELQSMMVDKELQKRKANSSPEANIRKVSTKSNQTTKSVVTTKYSEFKNPPKELLKKYVDSGKGDGTSSSKDIQIQVKGFLKLASKTRKPTGSFTDVFGEAHVGYPDRIGRLKYTGPDQTVVNGYKLEKGKDYYVIYLKQRSDDVIAGAGLTEEVKERVVDVGWIIVPEGFIEPYLLDYYVAEGDDVRIENELRNLRKNLPISNTFDLTTGTFVGSSGGGETDIFGNPIK